MTQPLTLDVYWMGRDKTYPHDLTREIELNAGDLVGRCNMLARELPFPLPRVTSGWRPPSINASIPNAAKRSNHMIGNACDFHDPNGEFDAWCMEHLDVLERIGLWLESPTSTSGWCHLQRVAPRSGKRVFIP